MSQREHRRIAFTGDALPDDPDWATLRTSPTFGDDLEAGEVSKLVPRGGSRIMVSFEVFDGELAGDAPTTPTPAATLDWTIVTINRVRDNDVYSYGLTTTQANQQRGIERELPPGGSSFIRVTSATVVGAGAVVILVDEVVQP